MKAYKHEGNKALKDNTRGVKFEDKKFLSTAQEKEIQKMILDMMPDQLKLDYALWTSKAVKELVERQFGVVLAVNTNGEYLRKCGFTPQKLKKRAYDLDPKAQKWLDEEYTAI